MPESQIRLLSLDGGGVRGLASLKVLKKLLALVGDPKPSDFFDMICGTSTGGLIAIMLGILEMTVDDCIEVFTTMMAQVFVHKRSSFLSISLKGKVKGRYSTSPLEKCIKNVLEEHGKAGYKMRELSSPTCKVVVVAMDKYTASSVYFSNYGYPGDEPIIANITILDAALATTAATSFFEEKEISIPGSTRVFCDAALGENNPVNALWAEARRQFGNDLEPRVRCLLSLGTGVPPTTKFGDDVKGVFESILKIAKETSATHRAFRDSNGLAKRGAYHRFSPPDIYNIRIDDPKMPGEIESLTMYYLREEAERVEKFKELNHPDSTPERDLLVVEQQRAPINTRIFQNLSGNNKYLCKGPSYWRHLTLGGYEKYQKMYEDCKPRNRSVGYLTFKEQFRKYRGDGYDPEPRKIEEVWCRVLRDGNIPNLIVEQTTLQKALVIAAIYMLHVETSFHTRHERPTMSNGQPGIDRSRREVLKRFTKWVPCQCSGDCDREWNFVNDIGLSRPEGYDRKCRVVEVLERKNAGKLLAEKGIKVLEDMRDHWYRATL